MANINKPRIVIDTNIILVCVPKKSKYNWIIQKLLAKELLFCVSNDIITEYEEKLSQVYSPKLAKDFKELLAVSISVLNVNPYYHWNLISSDPDDNKFVDCAVAADADFIVTDDGDYKILNSIDFPRLTIKNLDEFSQLMGISY